MATINGVYHPTDSDTYALTGTGAGGGDLGLLAASAAMKAVDEAAAAAAAIDFNKGTAASNQNWNTTYTAGNYYTGNAANVAGQSGLAEATPSAVLVTGNGNEFGASQVQIPVSGDFRMYVRSKRTSAEWTPWANLAPFLRGTASATQNWDTTFTPGNYYTGTAANTSGQTGLAENTPSVVMVTGNGNQFGTTQTQTPVSGPFRTYSRSKLTSADWSPWTQMQVSHRTASATQNWDETYAPGNYYTGGAGNVAGQTGLAVNVPSNVLILGTGTNFTASQFQTPVNGDGTLYYRAKRTSTTWTAWKELTAGGSGGGSGEAVNWTATPASHGIRVQAFKDDYPLVSTGGKGCVVFRYDHGLTNLKDHVLPVHQSRGVPLYIAMNSRTWTDPSNAGATQAEAAAWPNVEWGNHTADHQDRDTAEGMYDTIVNGRRELEDQLGRVIHGFTVPGVSGFNQFEGFAGGNIDAYSGTLAGGLILANHGVTSGNIGALQRPLDGIVRQGSRHWTWEQAAFADIKDRIDAAVSGKTALTLMAHPANIGRPGYLTATLVEQVVNYVADKIAAGDLANISYYQSHHATTASI